MRSPNFRICNPLRDPRRVENGPPGKDGKDGRNKPHNPDYRSMALLAVILLLIAAIEFLLQKIANGG